MPFVRTHRLALLLLAGGLGPLAFALISQYGFGQPPCHFCILQRYPYGVVALCGALLLLAPSQRYLLTAFAIMGWLVTGGLGLYHTGIERGWVTYHGACVTDTDPAKTLDELRTQITTAPRVSCEQPLGSFLGLSMASWNSISALGWIFLALKLYRTEPQ